MRELGQRIGDVKLQRLADSVADAADRHLRTDRTNATYHSVSIAAGGDATIPHHKGHVVKWCIVGAKGSPPSLYETENDSQILRLHHDGAASTSVTLMIW
jgi:hypothetical protein